MANSPYHIRREAVVIDTELDVEDLVSRLGDHREKVQQFWDLLIPMRSTIDPEDERHVACGLGCQKKITPLSKAAAPACLSNCAICASQHLLLDKQRLPGFSYAATISDVEAQSKIDTMVATTLNNLEYAMQQIHEFGDAILKRWEIDAPHPIEGVEDDSRYKSMLLLRSTGSTDRMKVTIRDVRQPSREGSK